MNAFVLMARRNAMLRTLLIGCFICMGNWDLPVLSQSPTDSVSPKVHFYERVLPLLKERCFGCHSHSSNVMESELALDWKVGWEKGGSRGPAIIAGSPDTSLLMKAIRHELPDLKMPENKLSSSEISDIEKWIADGAYDDRETQLQFDQSKARDWWSLKPLSQVQVPADGNSNPIDSFVAARLRQNGLSLSEPTDKRTLIRRVFYDLTGVPPSPSEIRDFEADDSELAYENLVERLLASDRYGERWARHWFDTIHFADSHGYEHDVGRDYAWPYRDYMISALNSDRPWSRLIQEQLAADHFFPNEPQLTPALGFLGAGTFDLSTFSTAPITFDYLDRDDLVTQTTAAFLSTTANCARCHSHKFDPISQEDYYSLQAVFSGVLKGDITYDSSFEVAKRRSEFQSLINAADERDSSILLAANYMPHILDGLATSARSAKWEPLELQSFVASEGSTLSRGHDNTIIASGLRPERETYIITATSTLTHLKALRLDVVTHNSLPMGGPGRADNGNLHLSEIGILVFDPAATAPIVVKPKRATADFNQADWGIERAIDGNPATAWGIHPSIGQSHYAVFQFQENVALPKGASLSVVLKQLHGGSHLIGAFQLSATSDDEQLIQARPVEVERVLLKLKNQSTLDWESIAEPDKITLASFFLRNWSLKERSKLPTPLRVFAAGPSVAIPEGNGKDQLQSVAAPKQVHVLHRGDFDKPRDVVSPGALSVLAELPNRLNSSEGDKESMRRAYLAEWISHKDNVLTWRSIVNRVWHYHFGRGLCDTPSDFGRMGDVPSHSELIDWLAIWFRDDANQSLKALHRLIVTSKTYRQVSAGSAPGLSIDSENRLLWRQNRQRLDADAIRDSMLVVSGQMDYSMGGPGVQHFVQSKGPQATPTLDYRAFDWNSPAGRRRSIYRYVWRGIADPFMESVDFPDLGLLSPVRGFSASSLQALSLFNNDFTLFQSQALATQLQDTMPNLEECVREAVWRIWARGPKQDEITELCRFAEENSLAELCRVMMNSNEFLFVD